MKQNAARIPNLTGVQNAQAAIPACFRESPQVLDPVVGQELGCSVVLKLEIKNPIRSFKGRGAEYFFSCAGGSAEFVCASAGNFGQGVAYAAARRGLRSAVFVPEGANTLKIERMREFGAEVIIGGADLDAAKASARIYAAEREAEFVEDGRNPEITEGAGTIGVELCAWPEPFDVVSCPVGNGALINGIGLWMKTHSAQTEMVGVCAANAPAMARSWRSGRPVSAPSDTIADGIAVREPVDDALELMYRTTDDMVLVSEEAIVDAMRLLYRTSGLMIEPAGIVGIAAILSHPSRFRGALVAVPLCGGNVTRPQAEQWFGAE